MSKYSVNDCGICFTEIGSEKTVIVAVERIIINKVYINALYPNGDGDRDRDR